MAQSMAASVSWGLPAEEPDPLEIDVYHGRYWFFTTMEIVFTTMESDFLSPWKLILTTLESFSFS